MPKNLTRLTNRVETSVKHDLIGRKSPAGIGSWWQTACRATEASSRHQQFPNGRRTHWSGQAIRSAARQAARARASKHRTDLSPDGDGDGPRSAIHAGHLLLVDRADGSSGMQKEFIFPSCFCSCVLSNNSSELLLYA